MVDEPILPCRKRFGVIRPPETGECPIVAVTGNTLQIKLTTVNQSAVPARQELRAQFSTTRPG